MNILIKFTKPELKDSQAQSTSIGSLRIFIAHKSSFDKERNIFIHFILVIGYSGGDTQEECFYKIEGSNLEKSTIWISTNEGADSYQHIYKNQTLINIETELNEFDKQMQIEFIEVTNRYLIFHDTMDYYYLNNGVLSEKKDFLIVGNNPVRIFNFLNNVYWPFSTYW